MIQITYTEIKSNIKTQSDFKNQDEYDQHKSEHPEMYDPEIYLVEEEDTTKKVELIDKLSVKRNRRLMLLTLIDYIGLYNDENADSATMQKFFSQPAYIGFILSLITGAPKTAKNILSALDKSGYPPEFIEDINKRLDEIIELKA